MNIAKVPMTEAGHVALQEELKHLKSVDRPNVIQAISEARAHGDLSENAEYHAAKERQSFIEARIADLEDKLSRAEVIDVAALSGSIKFGATVTLIDEDDKKSRFKLVGEEEADVKSGLISIASPLGRALIGKDVGDEVEVVTPGGGKSYEVEKVEYK